MSISIAEKSPIVNVALELNGIERSTNEHHVRFDNINGLLSTSFSIEVWVKPFQSGNGQEMALFSYFQAGSGGTNCFTYLSCRVANTYLKVLAKADNKEYAVTFSQNSKKGFADEMWHHLVITWAGASSELNAFWDQELLLANSKIQIENYQSSTEDGLLVLGQNLSSSDGMLDYQRFFSGQISYFRVWSAAWSKLHVKQGKIPNYVPENTWEQVTTRTALKQLAIYDNERFGLNQQGFVVSSTDGQNWAQTQSQPIAFNAIASCSSHVFAVDSEGVLHHSSSEGMTFSPLDVPLLTAKITQIALNDKTANGLSLVIMTDTEQVFYYTGFDANTYNPMSWMPLSFNHAAKGFQQIAGFIFFLQNGDLYFQYVEEGAADVPFDFNQPKDAEGNDDPIVQVVSQWPWNETSFILALGQSGNLYRHNPTNGFWDPVQNANNTFVIKDFGVTADNYVFALDDQGNLYLSSNRLILSSPDDIRLGVRMTLNLLLNEGYGQTVYASAVEPGMPAIEGVLYPTAEEDGRADTSPDWVVNNRYSTMNFIRNTNAEIA